MKTLYRIVIDVYDIRNRNVGLGEFSWQLATHLAERASDLRDRYGLLLYFVVPPGYKGCFGTDVRYLVFSDWNRLFFRFYPMRVDLCHMTQQFSRIKHMHFARHHLMTVHDINFLYEKSGRKAARYARRFRASLRHTDCLAYISNFTETDVERHFAVHKPGRVIYNGVTDLSKEPATGMGSEALSRLPQSYLLHLSRLKPKKNAHLLIEMMRYLPEENLVIVGNWNGKYAQQMKDRIAELSLHNVFPLDHVSNADKATLYRHCRGFLFPSLCEGFGLPPVEAMYFGKPVFLSRYTSLPEIGGPENCFFDNLTPEPMAETVRSGLKRFADDDTASERVRSWAKRFDWDECADGYLRYYLDMLNLDEVRE